MSQLAWIGTRAAAFALIGTLDTKGDEILFVKQRLCALGAEVLVIDVGVLGAPPFQPDVSGEEIAARAGTQLENLVLARDRGKTIAAMERGVASWFRERRDIIAGVLAIGGSAGTSIATAGMRELPVGVPKLMLWTLASGNTRPYVGTSDIGMLYPVADFGQREFSMIQCRGYGFGHVVRKSLRHSAGCWPTAGPSPLGVPREPGAIGSQRSIEMITQSSRRCRSTVLCL